MNKKKIITVVTSAIFATSALVGALASVTDGFKKMNPKDWTLTTDTDKNIGNGEKDITSIRFAKMREYNDENNNIVKEVSYSTALVDDALKLKLNWTTTDSDDYESDTWHLDKSTNEYLKAEISTDKKVIRVTCLKPFGRQIELCLFEDGNEANNATLKIDYVRKMISDYSITNLRCDFKDGEKISYTSLDKEYSIGSKGDRKSDSSTLSISYVFKGNDDISDEDALFDFNLSNQNITKISYLGEEYTDATTFKNTFKSVLKNYFKRYLDCEISFSKSEFEKLSTYTINTNSTYITASSIVNRYKDLSKNNSGYFLVFKDGEKTIEEQLVKFDDSLDFTTGIEFEVGGIEF